MSHISKVDVGVMNPVWMRETCEEIGMELIMDQKTFQCYPTYMGGKLPEGFSPKDWGKCDHAIRIKGAGKNTYEVGVCTRNGKTSLLYDEWEGGHGLMDVIGKDACNLLQGYRKREIKANAPLKGMIVRGEQMTAQGDLVLRLVPVSL